MATQSKKQILNKKEKEICQKVVDGRESVEKKRAVALLALNDGVTRTQASVISGLTIGQVNYLVNIFNKKRMDIFSEEITGKLKPGKNEKKSKKQKKEKKKDKKKKKGNKDKSAKRKKSKKKKQE